MTGLYRSLPLVLVCGMCFFDATGNCFSATSGLSMISGKNVAVVTYAKTDQAADYVTTVQTHLESIVNRHNEGTVLDQKQAEKLKADWQQLEDPDYFVTDEDFAKQAAKYQIDTLVRAYVRAEPFKGLADYYSATAHVDLRCIGPEAKVSSATSNPMGAPGCPPSDGLTEMSAIVNAIQRAVDDVARKVGLRVIPVSHQAIPLTVKGPLQNVDLAVPMSKHKPENNPEFHHLAELENKTWRKEKVTCTAKAPGGELAAVAGYLMDTDFRRRPRRLYGSCIHLVDFESDKEIIRLDCHELGYGRGATSEVLDCRFLSSWRYFAAVSGRKLFLWDTERGRLMCTVQLRPGLEDAALQFAEADGGQTILCVTSSSGTMQNYAIVRRMQGE